MFRVVVLGGIALAVAPGAALVTAGCGGSVSTPADAGAGADTGFPQETASFVDASVEAAPVGDSAVPDGSGEAGYLACMSASGQVDGALKACHSDGDCVIKQEQTDCCGTNLYVGVSSSSAAAFDACEAAWVAHFPACGCDSNKSTTEDGKKPSLGLDGGGPQVHCTDFTMSSGVCMTYTP